MQQLILGIIIIGAVIIFFFPKPFISSAGFVDTDTAIEFEASKKECIGYSHLTNPSGVAADEPGRSVCFGWLY